MSKLYLIVASLFLIVFVSNAQQVDTIKSKELDEVIVKGKRQPIKIDGPKTIISLSETPYAGYHDFMLMLENLPGMSPSASGPVVAGVGTPVYYIDDREIKDLNELKSLEPSNIQTIEVNRMPGIEYSGAAAVVKIKLKKSINDFVYLNVGVGGSQRRMFGYNTNLNFRFKYNKFSTSFSMNGGEGNTELKETYTRNIYHIDQVNANIQKRNYKRYYSGLGLNFIAEYRFSPVNLLGFYYNYRFDRDKPNTKGLNSEDSFGKYQEWQYHLHGNEIDNKHNFTLMWESKSDNVSLRITQDAYLTASPGKNIADEINTVNNNSIQTINNTDSKYQTYTTNAKMWLSNLPWGVGAFTNLKYDRVNSKSSSYINRENADYRSNMSVHEDNVTAFIGLTKSIGKFHLQPAIKYVYTHRNIESFGNIESGNIVKQHYSNFLPSMYFRWNVSSQVALYGKYEHSITQPGFRALNSGLIYINQWEWEQSNTELEATVQDYFAIGATWKSLYCEVSYGYAKNGIVSWESLMTPNSDAVAQTNVNMPIYQKFSATVSYSGQVGKFGYHVSGSVNIPKYKMIIRDKQEVRNKPQFYANANISYRLNNHFSFTSSYTFTGQGWSVPLVYCHCWQKWDIGIQGSFLNKKLSVSCGVSDILKTANYSNNISYFNNISYQVSGTSDSRGVYLNISYTIFNKDITTRTQKGNDEITNRIY